ncbi:MAG: aminopeptidase [Promethearchaeota archaeon]
MYNDFNEKLAQLAIRYALGVQPGDQIMLDGSEIANDLIRELYIEVLKAGGHPAVQSGVMGLSAAKFKYGSDEQIAYFNPMQITGVKEFQGFLQIYADHNRKKLTMVPPEKQILAQTSPKFIEFMTIMQTRVAKKEFKWSIVPYPCNALASDADMDLETYKEFVYHALHLDEDDPAGKWLEIEKEQDKIVEYLNKVEKIQVIGEDTNLTLLTNKRPWENCCGHNNLPDGEVFTSPVEDSINGYIRFTYPGMYQGKEIENIKLEFENGKVVKATADKGQELLDTILSIENAEIVGEFAVGTNYGITTFSKNMLFDEKMGGTMHMALGRGFPQTKSENLKCPIHWDILKDMKSEDSKIIADGVIINNLSSRSMENLKNATNFPYPFSNSFFNHFSFFYLFFLQISSIPLPKFSIFPHITKL